MAIDAIKNDFFFVIDIFPLFYADKSIRKTNIWANFSNQLNFNFRLCSNPTKIKLTYKHDLQVNKQIGIRSY